MFVGPADNAFVSPHNQLAGLGSYMVLEIANQHSGPCTVLLQSREKFIISLSRNIVVLELQRKLYQGH